MVELDDLELEMLRLDILEYFDYKYGVPKDELLDNEIFYPFYYSDTRYDHAFGGRAGGKSRELIGKYSVVHLSCLPFCRIVGIRQVFNSIKGSMFQEVVDYIDEWKLNRFFKITRSPMKITHIESGNYMTFAGMDKPDSIKSIKDPTHIIMEEARQVKDEEGVNMIDKSLRTPKLLAPFKHKMVFLYNTENTDTFLYEQNHDPENAVKYKKKRDNSLMVKVTYKDNKFLPQSIIDIIEADREMNPERFLVDGEGEWGRLTIDGLFYNSFNYASTVKTNVKRDRYNRLAPLHITLDFNVEPYISLIVNQIYYDELTNTLEIAAIDEICLKETQRMGKIDETMKEFLKKYKRHIGNVCVHGDRSGHSRKTTGKTDFATVFDYLKKTPKSKMIIGKQEGRRIEIDPYPEFEEMLCKFKVVDQTTKSSNPSLIGRKVLFQKLHSGQLSILPLSRTNGTINASGGKRALSQQYGGAKVVQIIDADNCPMLIRDYMEVTEDPIKGGKSDKPYHLTHTSDAEDYLVKDILEAEFNQIEIELKH